MVGIKMKFDHVALISKDIKISVDWYVNHWNAKILYQDETWGLIKIGESKIAFVLPHQHPSHICFEVDEKFICDQLHDKTFKSHRDGSSSCYIRDPDDNFLEFLYWPKKRDKQHG
jgi:catechol 2,3-dioxygenase-like lactoylglutathione lyase family enzyme